MSVSRAETKKVRALQTKKGRRLSGCFLAEGVRLLEEALRLRRLPENLFYSEAVLSPRGRELVAGYQKLGIAARAVTAADCGRMAGSTTPQGVLAVFEIPETSLAKLRTPNLRNVLVCENLSDPGNVGTLIRTATAFDFDLVVLCGRCAEPYAPKVVRSSMGAVFATPIALSTAGETLDYIARREVLLVAAGLKGKVKMREALAATETSGLALAIGSEADGLSDEFLARADHVVRIDHSRKVESLNSAIAGAILMRECFESRARRKL